MDAFEKFHRDHPNTFWFCLMTFGKEEYATVDRLNAIPHAGPLVAYCPVNLVEFTPRTRYKPKNPKIIMVQRPMIPGYVFVAMEPSDTLWWRIRNTRGVYGTLVNHSVPVRIPHEMIMTLRSAEPDVCKIDPVVDDTIRIGDAVVVERGQFKGSSFIIRSINGPLATLNATLFGKDYPLVLPLSFLVHDDNKGLAPCARVPYNGGQGI